ncbi:aspartate carbamoyltransferase [Candidatus Peregrinibacteria bacterium]|nr:aspartate carbamoyltransferase [Candidatus Peregrinibacteria bacterium]
MANFKGADILSTKTLSKGEILRIMEVANDMLPFARKEKRSNLLEGKILASLFFEPSTRTRLSFETAMNRLGGKVITISGSEGTSMVKGETIEDTAKMVEQYADVIAIRHGQMGAPAIMADNADIPVLSGGDGAGEHPTQGLLDLFTILHEKGRFDAMKITIVGDLKHGRTVHSLSYLLSNYDVELNYVSPKALALPEKVTKFLDERGANYKEMESLEEGLEGADILYMTRVQKERFEDPEEGKRLQDTYVLNREMIERINPNVVVMHPLPRVNEISTDVDDLPTAAYFRQAGNGVAVRMALLALVLGKA